MLKLNKHIFMDYSIQHFTFYFSDLDAEVIMVWNTQELNGEEMNNAY